MAVPRGRHKGVQMVVLDFSATFGKQARCLEYLHLLVKISDCRGAMTEAWEACKVFLFWPNDAMDSDRIIFADQIRAVARGSY